jgi:dihydrofolate reductase
VAKVKCQISASLDGTESAIARAREVAGDADVSIGGGASTLHQALLAGLLDEILVNQVPILLGAGERLFDEIAADSADFELARLVEGREAAHLTYRVSR